MRVCDIPGCGQPHKAHGLCQSHYDRERGERRRAHHERLIRQRARQRATQALVRLHREEFAVLLEAERQAAYEQAERIGEALLRSGRAAADQDEIDRLRLLQITCPACAAEHGGHLTCPGCGTHLDLAGVA